jgi:hypothetical protein
LIYEHIYYVSKQDGNCPINQTPTPPISTDQIFCESENATISNLIITGQNINGMLHLLTQIIYQ